MKRNIRCLLGIMFLSSFVVAQQHDPNFANNIIGTAHSDSLIGLNVDSIIMRARQHHLNAQETQTYLERSKRIYIAKKYNLPNPYTTKNAASRDELRSLAVPSCTNIDFEAGDFSAWSGFTGDNSSSSGPLSSIVPGFVSTTINTPVTDCNAQHTILQAPSANDPCGNFPVIPPNAGQYIVRLGNNCVVPTSFDNYSQYFEQTFTVDPSNTNFTYRYAAVLNDGLHLPNEQPYLRIDVLDAAGAPISNCLQYYVAANSGADGFLACPSDPLTYYKDWTTITFDLQNYINQNITVRFTTAGCIYGGHYGYAYIDCSCSSIADAVGARFCSGSSGAVLVASSGFAGYQWFDPNGNPIPNSNNDSLYINNAQNGDTFTVEMQAIADTACITPLSVVIEISEPQTSISAVDPSCQGANDGSATANCADCIPPVQYTWNTNPAQITQSASNLAAGTYIVSYLDSIGCTARDTIRLLDPEQQDTVGITTQFCIGDPQITLTGLPGQPGYQWYNDTTLIPGATSQTYIVTNPVVGAIYQVEYATTPCSYRDLIVLNYTPPANLFSPDSLVNVFTPNGDGKNDFFYPYYDARIAMQTGETSQPAYDFTELYIGTYEIWVYNRWGREVFYSNDYNVGWDGRMNGSESADGVYYWVAKYSTRCTVDDETIEQHGFVHLMR